MVTSVTPDRYASGEFERTYVVRGENLDLIPEEAVGIYTDEEANPLKFRYQATNPTYMFEQISREPNEIVLQQGSVQHGYVNYLGGIVSRDGSVVYWQLGQ